MMPSSQRALRRHYQEVKKARALRIYANGSMKTPEEQAWVLRKYNHLHMCSCYMCGHYRKWSGITLQERRSLLAIADAY